MTKLLTEGTPLNLLTEGRPINLLTGIVGINTDEVFTNWGIRSVFDLPECERLFCYHEGCFTGYDDLFVHLVKDANGNVLQLCPDCYSRLREACLVIG